MHTRDELVDAAMAAFDATMQRAPGFRSRAGQRAMALEAAQAFAAATLGETADQPERDIRVLQAGTGVGKSAAYAVVGITIAKLRGVKLVLSSSSVALQEQLLTKDLPLLAAHMPEPFTFAIAKGRGRYACVLKLQELAAGDPQLLALDDGPDSGDALPTPPKDASGEQHQVHFYRRLAADLAAGTWAGDRDSLESPPLPNEWAAIAAERNTCTVRHCPRFNDCVYYRARSQLAAADAIVANHDLVLASLGAPVLPDLSKCLMVFDEAHHLPAKAIEHFASEVDLTRLGWLDKFPVALVTAAAELSHPLTIQPQALAREMKGALSDLGRLIWDLNASGMRESDGVCRLAENALHGPLQGPLAAVLARARELKRCAQDVCSAVRERMQDPEQDRSRWALHYAAIGAFAPRLGAVSRCMELLLNEGDEARQTAKWCSVSRGNSGTLFLHVHACPIIPGQLLAFHLWHRVRAGVLTSATLASCGSFSYFLREAGLYADPAVTTRSVPSPFDHRKQAQLIVQRTAVAPRNTAAFNAETIGRLAADLAQTRRGALVLFTSRRHMEETCGPGRGSEVACAGPGLAP